MTNPTPITVRTAAEIADLLQRDIIESHHAAARDGNELLVLLLLPLISETGAIRDRLTRIAGAIENKVRIEEHNQRVVDMVTAKLKSTCTQLEAVIEDGSALVEEAKR